MTLSDFEAGFVVGYLAGAGAGLMAMGLAAAARWWAGW